MPTSQRRLRLPHELYVRGGPPCHSLAHSRLVWMSTKTPAPWPMSLKITTPTVSPTGPSAPDTRLSINSPARSHRRPHASSVSLQLAPVAPGSLAIGAHQATTGGAWSPPSSRQRRVSGCKPTAAMPCHGPGGGAQETARPSLSPPWQMQPSVLAVAHVQAFCGPGRLRST